MSLEKFLNEVKQRNDLTYFTKAGALSRTDIEKLLRIAELITSMKHHQNEEDCMPSCAKCYLQEEADKIAGEEQ